MTKAAVIAALAVFGAIALAMRKPQGLRGAASPVRVKCRDTQADIRKDWRLEDDEGVECWGKCVLPIRAIKMRNVTYPRQSAIIHPSTKYGKGSWQTSIFDEERGPMYDQPADSCDEALAYIHSAWHGRLTSSGPKPNYTIEEWA